MSLDAFVDSLHDENIGPLDCSKTANSHKSPALCRSILKPSNFDNLIDLKTPQHKHLKVHFETPSVAKLPVETPPQTPGKQVTPTRYEDIRVLDENECWLERTAVVTKADHEEYIKLAKEFVDELIANLPILQVREEHITENQPPPQPKEEVSEEAKEEQEDAKDTSAQEFFDAEEGLVDTPNNVSSSGSREPVAEQGTATGEAVLSEGDVQKPQPTSLVQEPEEFQDTVEPKEEKEEKMNDTGETSPIPIPKGSYNYNFDDFDENTDPFACKKGLAMSPPKTGGDAIFNSGNEGVDDNIDPFKTKSKMKMSPPKGGDFDENINPFQTKSKVAMSPPKHDDFDENMDPFKTKSNMAQSPPKTGDFGEDIDPFQTKSKVAMSPPKHDDFDENIDPFKTKSKMANSPPKEEHFDENIDPFQTKSKVGQSPPKSENFDDNIDPFKTKTKVAQSPPNNMGFDENVNPFETKTQLANSPPKSLQVDNSVNMNGSYTTDLKDNNGQDKVEPEMNKEQKKTQKKKSSPTKQAPKKFKRPVGQIKKDPFDSDIEIFAPKAPSAAPQEESNNNNVTKPESHCDSGDTTSASDSVAQKDLTDSVSRELEQIVDQKGDNIFEAQQAGQETELTEEETFKPADEVFNDPLALDMLEKFGGRGDLKESALGRQSLYVKFDPLVKGAESPAILKNKQLQSVAESGNDDLLCMNTPPLAKVQQRLGNKHPAARVLEHSLEEEEDREHHQAVDKLLAFSPPAPEKPTVSEPQSTLSSHELTQTWVNHMPRLTSEMDDSAVLSQDSLDCMSMSWSQENGRPDSPLQFDHEEVVRISCDPDLSDSGLQDSSHSETADTMGSSEGMGTDAIVQVLKYSQAEWNTKKQEMELDFQARLLAKERTWDKKLQEQKKETEKKQKENQKLQEQIEQLQASNKEMGSIVAEFEKTISQMISEKNVSKESVDDVLKERDQAVEDLQSVEAAFSDLHRRYEKTKEAVTAFKKNEQVLKKCVTDYQERLKAEEQKYQTVKAQAEEKLETANNMVEDIRKTTSAEIATLQLALKKAELRAQSIEESYEQKVRENKELAAICDELIAKVGGSN
ncbi:transforming acidic coiled-coil-containing protein 2 isoform X2 [Lingula anatina]|uniref:Transforming acidic coiled-coil-containing protein 2 isoform X2 n=1 Tax=Lingula anatina TaxID=7574 RepID=A0A2R2MQ31_LINAN|nr:transforming acidic coiled-coil-containing protein 2 isoform X2 [Lingula anatina]|eukprot:XP_023932122.1 transforming acidic coiled-coil-containing protein 2 isoform X2 [Lingula anatina]